MRRECVDLASSGDIERRKTLTAKSAIERLLGELHNTEQLALRIKHLQTNAIEQKKPAIAVNGQSAGGVLHAVRTLAAVFTVGHKYLGKSTDIRGLVFPIQPKFLEG